MWLERFLRELLGMGGGQALEEEILNLGSWCVWGGCPENWAVSLQGQGGGGWTEGPHCISLQAHVMPRGELS